MQHVDALSRMSCLIIETSLSHRMRKAQELDDLTKAIRAILGFGDYEDYFMKNGVLFKDPVKELIVVPVQMESEIIMLAHKQGHYGVARTQEIVEKQYYIPQIVKK